jgi:uncharacterized membrane protein
MVEEAFDHFEMRRLESLSNTIFGVAMTLLAYDLPRAAAFANPPTWADLYHLYSARLIALMLSFVIAGVFWVSHQRRLVRQPHAGRGVVLTNLFFLLSIILLPVSNGLYGTYGRSTTIAVLYGWHLTTIAAFNAWLWWIAARGHRRRVELAASLFPVLFLLSGTAVAAFAPQYALYLWLLAFGGVVVPRFFGKGPAAQV